MSTVAPSGWEGFSAAVATVAGVDAGELRRDSRVVEDLGFDSLQLVEVLVLLIDEYGVEGLHERIEDRAWEDVTLGELFDELAASRGRSPG